MLKLIAETREGKVKSENCFPGVLYGPKIKNISLEVDAKEFEKVLKEAGESSLVDLETDGKKYKVLIHEIQREPMSDKIIHVDFYQPLLDQEIEAKVPLVFEGEAPAIKNLGGTLFKNMHEIEVRALPQDLPHQIAVNVGALETFENEIQIKDLILPPGVKVIKDAGEVVVKVMPIQKVEEELEKPIEEDVEKVEKVEEKKTGEEEAVGEETAGKEVEK